MSFDEIELPLRLGFGSAGQFALRAREGGSGRGLVVEISNSSKMLPNETVGISEVYLVT
jgi:hypothetical protein